MTPPSPETVAAALKLAEAVSEHDRETSCYEYHCAGAEPYNAVVATLRAYRASLPKLRTRAEQDQALVRMVRSAPPEKYDETGWCGIAQMLREPTAEPEATDENGDPIPMLYKDCGKCRYPTAGKHCDDEWCQRRGCCGNKGRP